MKSKSVSALLVASTLRVVSIFAQTFTPEELRQRAIERRAVEAAIWGMPIVAADAIRQGFLDLGAKYNDIAYFSGLPDWRFQTTTPNASTHYIYSAYSLDHTWRAAEQRQFD